jgi:pimeloyl-ACP methyl ester carboxylesterase
MIAPPGNNDATKKEIEMLFEGNDLYDRNKYDEAIKYYDRAIELDPNNHLPWMNKGNALDNLGRYDEAIVSFSYSNRNNDELKSCYGTIYYYDYAWMLLFYLSPYVDTHLVSQLFWHDMVYNPNVVIPGELIRNYSNVQGLPYARYAPILKGRLSQINCPTLLVWGHNDKMVPIEYSKDFIDEIPNCKLHVLRDCGHIPHIEKPIEFGKIIQDFLL